MKRLSVFLLPVALAFMPLLVLAQSNPDLDNVARLVMAIGRLVNLATPIIIGLALLAFFWGLVKYIFAAADDDKASGKSLMIGGIIAIFVMVSIVGIIQFIGGAFNIGDGGSFTPPTVEGL